MTNVTTRETLVEIVGSLAEQLDKSEEQNTTLRAEVEWLKKALAEIAQYASDIPESYADGHQIVTECGHFRRARAALAAMDKP